MAKKNIVKYTTDFPEIDGRSPYEAPNKQLSMLDGHNEVKIVEGRRPSELLLVNDIRAEVDAWRLSGWLGASDTTHQLFQWWFEDITREPSGFRPYWGQREALETLAYLVEVKKTIDLAGMLNSYVRSPAVRLERPVRGGSRQIVLPNLAEPIDLPPDDLGRYAFKMATGSGKTLVMALIIVWSFFHTRRESGSPLSDNFLVLAPNVIVFERLRVDFENLSVFRNLGLVPPGWRMDLKVILRGDTTELGTSGNLIVTNIQQLYKHEESSGARNIVQTHLGRKPSGQADTSGRPLLDRFEGINDLLVLNDEAHHVHDEELMWNKTLQNLNSELPGGLALWLDFSATPKFRNGTYFPWVVSDYPLAQAVEDGIVKTPTIMHLVDSPDPGVVTGKNVIEKYEDWLIAGVRRLKDHEKAFRDLRDTKPVMFIMCESIQHADKVGDWLRDRAGGGLADEEVLVIHTDNQGEVRKKDLDQLRRAARDIDDSSNPVRAVVSVLVLREGWDVRNVTIVMGLRPGTASAKILPEQAVGRGLRLMKEVGPDYRQVLEVLGTPAFEDFVRGLETEGVFIPTKVKPPKLPVTIQAVKDRENFDIAIPRTGPILKRVYTKMESFDPLRVDPVASLRDLQTERDKIRLDVEEALTKKKLGQEQVERPTPPLTGELVGAIVRRVEEKAHLTNSFAHLAPKISTYLAERCFGGSVDLETEAVRRHLSDYGSQETIATKLAFQLGRLTTEEQPLEVTPSRIKLSESQPFLWRRETTSCEKTIFNLVATYNPFETSFAEFLDRCPDVLRFAALAEHFTLFSVEYLKPTGALGHYYPDWVVVQQTNDGVSNWIIETKGREWPGTTAKDAAVHRWCRKVSEGSEEHWKYVRVNQVDFVREAPGAKTFASLLDSLPRVNVPKLSLIRGIKEEAVSTEHRLPLYSLEAAAGAFSAGKEVEVTAWVEVEFPVKEGMFAAKVVGRSMEPAIPDGSVALFRRYTGGSREGKVVLAQSREIGDPETGGSYTVKRYTAARREEEGSIVREAIVLQSDNPDVESIELDPADEVEIIAVFDRVLGTV